MTSRRRPAVGWTAVCCVLGLLAAHSAGAGVPPAPPACAVETATFPNTTPLALNDETIVTTQIVVSGAQPYLWDLDLETSIQHGYPGDLRIRLTSPEGTVVVVTTDSGAGNPEVFHGTVWDDDADPGSPVPYTVNPKIVSDYTFTATPRVPFLVPEGAMAAFIGEDPNGTWTLEIEDDAPGGEGFLESWDLHVTTLPGSPAFTLSDTFENTTPLALPDLVFATSTVVVPAGLGGRISNITAQTFLEHEWSADLEVTLTSPSGTVVTLTTDNGDEAANVFNGTVWSDDAPSVASDHVYQDGVVVPALVPEEAMGAFLAEDPAGAWTLTIADVLANDVGTLQSWSLTITTASCAEASAAVPVALDTHVSGGVADLNGVLEPGEQVEFEPSWTNESASSSFPLVGAATQFTGPAGAAYTIHDATADYGTIAPLATSNCFDATGDCYELAVDDPAVRPSTHWDAVLDEEATPDGGGAIPHAYTIHIGESFTDVPVTNPFYSFIETLFHNAVTGGCGSGTTYCPADSVTRAQMAVFILKSEHGPVYTPPACAGIFPDVACPSLFADWIEQLAAEGITGGCGGGAYCPNNPVTRAQMAVFLLKGRHGSDYVPPPCSGVFADVPCPSPFGDWIEQLAAEGITGGCGGGNYCPSSPVTRGQMAVFLTKTFGLALYGP